VVAIGQNKTRKSVRMLFENGTEIREFHVASIFLFRYIVKRVPGNGLNRTWHF
jgi:hypothetical protein